MAKAHQAPKDRKLRFTITPHALERFGERFGDWLTREGMLDPRARTHFLDYLIDDALKEGKSMLVEDNSGGEPVRSTVVDISDYDRWPGDEAIVLMRASAAITVLSAGIGRAKLEKGQWVPLKGMLHRLELARPLSTKLDLKGFVLPAAQAPGGGFEVGTAELAPDTTPPSEPGALGQALGELAGAARASLIAHAQTLLEHELKRRASEAFFARNTQLAEVLRDLSDELPEKLAAQLKELT